MDEEPGSEIPKALSERGSLSQYIPENGCEMDGYATRTAVEMLSEEPMLPLEVQMWNLEPAHSWTPGVRGHQRVQGGLREERAEGKGQGEGLGVEFPTTPAWVLEP